MRTIHIPVGVIKACLVLMAAIGAALLASTVTLPIMGSGVGLGPQEPQGIFAALAGVAAVVCGYRGLRHRDGDGS